LGWKGEGSKGLRKVERERGILGTIRKGQGREVEGERKRKAAKIGKGNAG